METSGQLETVLLEFFANVAARDAALLGRLEEDPAFGLGAQRWEFRLPALHAFLQDQGLIAAETDYKVFRKALFRCPVNEMLAQHRASIIIAENQGKVDRSTYALVWSDGS